MAPLSKVAVVIGVGPGICMFDYVVAASECSASSNMRPLVVIVAIRVFILIAHTSAGIGAEAAKKFASKGYSVALLSRSLDKLTPVEKEISNAGGKAISLPADAGVLCSEHTHIYAVF